MSSAHQPKWGHGVRADSAATAAPTEPPKRKKRRVFLWTFLVVQLIFLIWLIVGLVSTAGAPDCTGLTQEDCEAATGLGATIGAGVIVAFWVAVDFILGISYLIYRAVKKD
ncbi:hypothetical protein [Streptomyces marispadix]|uniref:Integral membrane protein n=1 Tax=Streptomyces marispadix TaxID=2922868 RepID=A0ABS9SZ94_9ACTN|nr:hypothetical protein [Streptomyces marispadix]MCH6161572.1 hypothetical protein [Streptomyces marispadix]